MPSASGVAPEIVEESCTAVPIGTDVADSVVVIEGLFFPMVMTSDVQGLVAPLLLASPL